MWWFGFKVWGVGFTVTVMGVGFEVGDSGL